MEKEAYDILINIFGMTEAAYDSVVIDADLYERMKVLVDRILEFKKRDKIYTIPYEMVFRPFINIEDSKISECCLSPEKKKKKKKRVLKSLKKLKYV
jgi:hypothetical protein